MAKRKHNHDEPKPKKHGCEEETPDVEQGSSVTEEGGATDDPDEGEGGGGNHPANPPGKP